MAEPTKIRATEKDGVTEVKMLVSHEMENGRRLDAAGAVVPAHFVTELRAEHEGRPVLIAQFGTAVSKNPYLVFRFRGAKKGDRLSISWSDNKGDRRSDEVRIV